MQIQETGEGLAGLKFKGLAGWRVEGLTGARLKGLAGLRFEGLAGPGQCFGKQRSRKQVDAPRARISSRCSLSCPWDFVGDSSFRFPLGLGALWFSCAFSLVLLWVSFGFSLFFLRCSFGVPLGFLFPKAPPKCKHMCKNVPKSTQNVSKMGPDWLPKC